MTHRCTAAIDLRDEHLPVVLGRRHLLEEGPRVRPDGVEDPQRGAGAGSPLEERLESGARLRERHLGAEAGERGRCTEAEAAHEPELPIDSQVGLPAPEEASAPTDLPRECDLAESRAQFRRAPLTPLPRRARVSVVPAPTRAGALREVEHDDGATDREQQPPRDVLEVREPFIMLLGVLDERADGVLDACARVVDTGRHRGSFRSVPGFATGYLP